MTLKKVGVAADHAGKELKSMVLSYLGMLELEVVDYGVSTADNISVDYPDYAEILAENLSKGVVDYGIGICGTGIGMAIAANKFPQVRATAVWDEYSVKMAREHNDINLLCLGARTLNNFRAMDLVKLFLETQFVGNRHTARLDKIRSIELKNLKGR